MSKMLPFQKSQQGVWHDPERAIRTLESFAETEADGARDIGRALSRTVDEDLKKHFARHMQDEHRHAEMFRTRARELREAHPEVAPTEDEKRYDLSRGRADADLDAHGFYDAGLIDDLGEISYVAMLYVAEQRAAKLFGQIHKETQHDAETAAVFAQILKDENYHVAYTKAALDKWKDAGRTREVKAAMSAAKGNRLWGAWKRLGVRSAAGFGHVLMRVMYWLFCWPFGLVARNKEAQGGFQKPSERPGSALAGQY